MTSTPTKTAPNQPTPLHADGVPPAGGVSAPAKPVRAAMWAFFLWTAAFLLTRLWWINAPFCNLECAFSQAAHALALSSERGRLDYYWETQANPLGYPLLAAPLIAITGLRDSYWLVRVPSLASMILLLGVVTAAWLRADRRDIAGLHAWLACVAFQPFFWLFAGQSTSDLTAVSLLHASMLFCWMGASETRSASLPGRTLQFLFHPLAGTLFTLAVLCKPTALLTGLGFVFILVSGSYGADGFRPKDGLPKRLLPLAWYTIWPGLILGAYALLIRRWFGIFLIPDQYWEKHAQLNDLPTAIVVFLKYVAFLAMFLGLLGPAALFGAWRRVGRRGLMIGAAVALLAAAPIYLYITPVSIGEMNFGVANHLAPPELFRLAETLATVLGIFVFVDMARRALGPIKERADGRPDPGAGVGFAIRSLSRFFLIGFVPLLMIASTVRPAQRYLMLFLPLLFGYLLLGSLRRHPSFRASVVALMLVLFVGVDLVGGAFMASQGQASLNMARKIADLGLTDQTDPGPVGQHTRQLFPSVIHADKASFQVIEQSVSDPVPDPKTCLAQEELPFLGHPFRRYLLVRKPVVAPVP